MAERVRLEVVTPDRAVISVETDEVLQIPGRDGLFGVLPGHCPFMTTLDPGVVRYLEGKHEPGLVVAGGFAIVRDDMVTILAEVANLPGEIDADAAQKDLSGARERLGAALTPEEDTAIRRDIALAEARIEAAAKG